MTSHVAVVAPADGHAIMERVIATGDLSQLTSEERNRYYMLTCQSVGLNYLTRPLEYIRLQGKLVLYAKRDAADQLRKQHGISLRIKEQRAADGLFLVTVEAQDKDGRVDADVGAVAINSLQGEARANAILKAITKAKRRVTLSICGLGMLDETEVADISAGERQTWEEPKAEAKTEPEPDMRALVQIVGQDGQAVFTGSVAREALLAYGQAKKRSTDPAAVARANIEALKTLREHGKVGPNTLTRLVEEIDATEALLEVAPAPEVDEDGVLLEGETPDPVPAGAEAA
jgi:hypothetical protein